MRKRFQGSEILTDRYGITTQAMHLALGQLVWLEVGILIYPLEAQGICFGSGLRCGVG